MWHNFYLFTILVLSSTVTVDLELYWYWGALGDFFFGGRIHWSLDWRKTLLDTSPASPPGQCHFAGSFWMHFLHASLSATITQFAPRSAIVWCEFCVDPSLAWTITLHSLLGPFQSNLSRKFSKSDFVERNSISTLYDNDFWLLLYRIASIAFLFNWTSISKLRAVEMLRFSIQR